MLFRSPVRRSIDYANPLSGDVVNISEGSEYSVRFNKNGLRGKAVPYDKADNEIRILALGNSCVFGFGVGEDEVFSSELEKLLQRRFPRKKITVINGGMPGFSSFNSLNMLGAAGMKYKPDVLIAYILNNDKALELREDMPLLKLRFIRLNWVLAQSGLFNLIREMISADSLPVPEMKRGKQTLRPKVSPEDYERNLSFLSDISRRFGMKLYYVIPLTPDDIIKDAAELEKFIYDNAEKEMIKALLGKKRLLIRETGMRELGRDAARWGQTGADFEKILKEMTDKRLAESGAEAEEKKKNISYYKRYNLFTRQYRSIMKKVAASEKAALLDLPDIIGREPGLRPMEFFLDEIHPSAYGHRIIAEQLFKRIASDLEGR